jgi:hypothetical protein
MKIGGTVAFPTTASETEFIPLLTDRLGHSAHSFFA